MINGIGVSQPFIREGGFPIDASLLLTKAQMRDMLDNMMPARYFCICLEDGKLYLYDKSATPNAETGKYFLYSNKPVSPFIFESTLPLNPAEVGAPQDIVEEWAQRYKDKLVFVPKSSPASDNQYDEWVLNPTEDGLYPWYYWEKVGDTQLEIDLSEYLKYTEVLSELLDSDKPVSARAILAALAEKQDLIGASNGIKKERNNLSIDEEWFDSKAATLEDVKLSQTDIEEILDFSEPPSTSYELNSLLFGGYDWTIPADGRLEIDDVFSFASDEERNAFQQADELIVPKSYEVRYDDLGIDLLTFVSKEDVDNTVRYLYQGGESIYSLTIVITKSNQSLSRTSCDIEVVGGVNISFNTIVKLN